MNLRPLVPPVLAVLCWGVLGIAVWAHPGHDAPDQDPGGAGAAARTAPATSGVSAATAAVPASSSGFSRGQVLVGSLTVFVLAIFVGFEVINKVPPTLHTPLMSGSNAISGITVVGAILAAGQRDWGLATWLGIVATALANINVVGGFLVTHRMLLMFKKR